MACSSPLHSHRKEQGLKAVIKFLPTQWSNTAGLQWLDYKGLRCAIGQGRCRNGQRRRLLKARLASSAARQKSHRKDS